MVSDFVLSQLHTFFCKLTIFEKLKTSVEVCFLHNRILMNSFVSFQKENKTTEHPF